MSKLVGKIVTGAVKGSRGFFILDQQGATITGFPITRDRKNGEYSLDCYPEIIQLSQAGAIVTIAEWAVYEAAYIRDENPDCDLDGLINLTHELSAY